MARVWLGREPEGCVDLQLIEPQPPSRLIRLEVVNGSPSADSARTIPIRQFLRTGPLGARAKVVILDEADRMTEDAAHALLKTLEEPPEYARFALTTTAISRILPTVLSRCVGLPVPLDGPDDRPDNPELLFAEGSALRAEAIARHGELYRELHRLLSGWASLPRAAALRESERLRDWAKRYAKESDSGERAATAEALRCVAIWLARSQPHRPRALAATLEAHRRIVGNANATYIVDALLPEILAPSDGSRGT